MKRVAKIASLVAGTLLLIAAWPAWQLYGEIRKSASEDPLVWEEDITALEAATAERASSDSIVFVGSSSIRLWSSLERDMQPFPVIQHGFGGAKLADLEFYAERLVNSQRPRAVVVFAGTNDIHPGRTKPPKTLLATYRRFVERVRADLPEVPIYFIGITPSPMRWEVWQTAQQTNRLVREFSEREPGLEYIETGPALLGADGEPNPDNYIFDGLHLSEAGYARWTEIIRGRLLADLGS
jgi:lysophospholipase L1-like esterase